MKNLLFLSSLFFLSGLSSLCIAQTKTDYNTQIKNLPANPLQFYGATCNGQVDDTPFWAQVVALTNPVTIIIKDTDICTVNSNINLPATVGLMISPGGQISIANGITFTINGAFVASSTSLIFPRTGQVQFVGIAEVYPAWFTGADCGVQINSAYASLSASGGIIDQYLSCSYNNGIIFGTNNKPVLLRGVPGAGTTLTYTGAGTALTLNYGTGLTMGKGFRDLTFTGPGNSTGTTGIMVGGTNGAQGTTIRDFKIQSFGTNMQFGNYTWIVQIEQGMIRDGGRNVYYPPAATLVESGENIQWNHVTFADAPSPFTNSVVLQTSESTFTDCSFDQAQLHIGNGTNGAAQVNIKGSHFENPNTGSPVYDYVVMDSESGNILRLTDDFFEQDFNEGTIPQFITTKGGNLYITNLGMYSPFGPVTQLINATGISNVTVWGFDDLSGQTATLVGGNSTGWMQLFGGNSINALIPLNFHFGPGAPLSAGGGLFDVTGEIRSTYSTLVPNSGILGAGAPTGTVPLLIGSTTPIPNMMANATLYQPNGTQVLFNNHFVTTEADLVGGTLTITLVGLAQFISNAQCGGTNLSNLNPFKIVITLPGTIVVTGTATDHISLVCIGY